MPDARIAFRPFDDQLAFFRRKINVPTARWDDLRLGDHAHGFMVAGLARADVLNDLREAIIKAQQGETLADFRKRFDDIVRGRWEGFTGDGSKKGRAWRTRVIYQTNLRTSYMAGRWETLRKFPFLQYNHHTIDNPREHHLAWDGLIIATGDPWWAIHYPPNGWGCRCDATGVSEQRLRVLGRSADPAPAPIDGDPPPEWRYHVGEAARSLPAAAAFGERVLQLPPDWRDIALADAVQRSADLFSDWPAVIGDVLRSLDQDPGTTQPIGAAAAVSWLTGNTVDRLAAGVDSTGRLFPPVAAGTATVAIDDSALISVLRSSAGPRIPPAFRAALIDLPGWLVDVDAVLWDSASRRLLYAKRDGRDYIVLVVAPDADSRTAGGQLQANWIRAIERRPRAALSALHLLEGSL